MVHLQSKRKICSLLHLTLASLRCRGCAATGILGGGRSWLHLLVHCDFFKWNDDALNALRRECQLL